MPPIVCATGGGACQHNIEPVWGGVYGEEEESGETLASLSSVAFYDGVRDHLEDSMVAPASVQRSIPVHFPRLPAGHRALVRSP